MKSADFEKRIHFMIRIPMLFMLWLVVLGSVAYGQGTATIVGTVTDPTGAVVPGANVKVRSLATNTIRETVSHLKDLPRYRQILATLVKYGYQDVVAALHLEGLVRPFEWVRLRRDGANVRPGQRRQGG